MVNSFPPSWICCQIGARQHYILPRALHEKKQLACLITDAWVSPQLKLPIPMKALNKLCQRFHPDLQHASIHAFTASLMRFELCQSLQKTSKWERTIARNYWFQKCAVQSLDAISQLSTIDSRPTVFAYSYAALDIFRYAKARGWRTILGQIDPATVEEEIVLEEHTKHPQYLSNWQPAPKEYWNNWQEECVLADQIVVNSLWSSQALQKVGIPRNKLNIIPHTYIPSEQAKSFVRQYPSAFSTKRPMRVLFLGQVVLRKGIVAILEAATILKDESIEFWLVGSQGIAKPQEAEAYKKVKWIGSVPRNSTAEFYQLADVFLFPTLSDGFGHTQLEAQAWKLPIIASKFCGAVVKNEENGLILSEVSGESIASALKFCFNNPQQLQNFAIHSANTITNFSLSTFQQHLLALGDLF
ncbi:glycosyltransferase family 4 protein [Gloeocapsa sp. BRSZ]